VDGAPAHTSELAQDWIATNCSEFIGNDEWPLNSPDVNPFDYRVSGVMLEQHKTMKTCRHNPKNTEGLIERVLK